MGRAIGGEYALTPIDPKKMMNCSEIKFFTPLYLSSELDATPMFDFELHLRRCSACARELEDARRCDDLLREALHQESLDTDELRRRIKTKRSEERRVG